MLLNALFPARWPTPSFLLVERRMVLPPHPQMVEVAVYARNAARENNR